MVSEEIIRLILDIQQNKDPADLAAKFQTLKTKLTETAAAYDVLERQVGEYAVAAGKADAATDKEVKAMVEATRARKFYSEVLDEHHVHLSRTIDTTNKGIGTKTAGGLGMLGISYAVQDFTSQIQNGLLPALSSVQNNIPQILTGLGVGTGMAGVVSLAAVGVGLAVPLISSMASGTKDAGEKAEEAAKKLHGFNDQLEKLVDAGKKLRESKTADEEATAKAVGGAVDAAGKRVIAGGLDAHLRGVDQSMEEAQIDDEMRRQGNEESFFSPDAWKKLRDQVRPKVRKDAMNSRQGRVDAIMGSLAGGDESTRQMVEGLARNNPNLFGAGTADTLRAASPQSRQSMEDMRKRDGTMAYGAEVDWDNEEWARRLPDTAPAPFSRRLPVGRLNEGPLADGARPARETPAQTRARNIAILQARPQPNTVDAQGTPDFESQIYQRPYKSRETQADRAERKATERAMKAGGDAASAALEANKATLDTMVSFAEYAKQLAAKGDAQKRMAEALKNAVPVQMRRGSR